MKPWLKMLGLFIVILLVAGGVWGFNLYRFISNMKAQGVPKSAVTTMMVETAPWQGKINAIATLRAARGADLVVEASGVVDKIMASSSANVAAGAPLITLRAEEERAQLASLQANAKLAAANYARDKAQFAFGGVSQAQLDASMAQLAASQAAVNQQTAVLNKKTLRAPFAGSLGIVQVSVGQWVSAGSKVISLQALDPILADFSLPQNDTGVIKVGLPVVVSSDALPGKTFQGAIQSVDSRLDPDTRTILVRALLPNPEKIMVPGMFGKVTINQGATQSVITLPQSAIVYSPYGDSVYLVLEAQALYEQEVAKARANGTYENMKATLIEPTEKTQKVVKQVFVQTGDRRGDQIAVLSGIKVGDEVVTSGQLKLKNGTHVLINNTVPPANNPNPTPSKGE